MFEHPLNGFPTSQTPRTYTQTCAHRPAFPLQRILSQAFLRTHAHIQKHCLNTLTHALITPAFPLPTVTDKQCPPLPSRCAPSPSRPLLHFSSHKLCSSPFLLCCGSSDRGIPPLLMPPMGWCAQMKTMYSNGSAKLPQFPANAGGVHAEVRSRQFQQRQGVDARAIALVQVAPERSLQPPHGLFSPPSSSTKPLLWV